MAKEFSGDTGDTPPSARDLRSLYNAISDLLIARDVESDEARAPFRGIESHYRFGLDERELPDPVREHFDQIPPVEGAEVDYAGSISQATYTGFKGVEENFPHPVERADLGFSRKEYLSTEEADDATDVGGLDVREVRASYTVLKNDAEGRLGYMGISSLGAQELALHMNITDSGEPALQATEPDPLDLPGLFDTAEPGRNEVNRLTNFVRGMPDE